MDRIKPQLSPELPPDQSPIGSDSNIEMISQWIGIIEERVGEYRIAKQREKQTRPAPQYVKGFDGGYHKVVNKPRSGKNPETGMTERGEQEWLEWNLEAVAKRGLIRFTNGKLELLPLKAEDLPEDIIHTSDFYRSLQLAEKRFALFDDRTYEDEIRGELVEASFDHESKELVLKNKFFGNLGAKHSKTDELRMNAYGEMNPNRPLYIADLEFSDKISLDIDGYKIAHRITMSLERASKFFKYLTLFIDKELLLKHRSVYLDPESLTQKRAYDEFGGSFFVRGGIPMDAVRDVIQGHRSSFFSQDNVLRNPPENGYVIVRRKGT